MNTRESIAVTPPAPVMDRPHADDTASGLPGPPSGTPAPMIRRAMRHLVPRSRRPEPAALIRHDDRATALRIAAILRRHGGFPGREAPGRFEFAKAATRDHAMNAVRMCHGWTSVEAADPRHG